ncbi:hypothetical protein SISSUDRAFT_1039182 [Sistotremastrum suecicum HHB10207 ss-3]|uniref:Uncharacterized protein n=1 Tax=Sistotremastrum suecicum HHB10207 ss-3 TaxID=1314776 RepID=A0A166JDU9_9AGAM|nr:hypothetical protein SISSUDRAFT_1039182 [Sistotremastrum suecicum HHB10207 ss-3]
MELRHASYRPAAATYDLGLYIVCPIDVVSSHPSTYTMNQSQPTKNTSQPTGKPQMALQIQPSIEEHRSHKHKASHVRGGGAGKDCFMGLAECFICFETCRICCDCFADIICCPCEMCC